MLRRRLGSRASQYSFSRSRTDVILPWRNSNPIHADETARFYLNKADVNGDNGYYIMNMKLALRDLPSYDEFRTLFTRYKLTGWDTRITPTFSQNMASSFGLGAANAVRHAIPNLEFFVIPTTYYVHPDQRDWADMEDDEIQSIIAQTQIKARRLMPSKGFTFKTKNPKIARTGFIPGRTDQAITQTEAYMGKAPWLENGPGEHHGGAPNNDQRRVMHYSFTVLCRRVDGGDIKELAPQNSDPLGTGVTEDCMQWRVTQQAYFKFDKVR